ncbi:unnamed protein product [Effrenium voratum]|nr:unnamed protein product [Effrenium voratum]
MRSFDAFARPVQEFQVKTAVGGYISIGAICLVLALFFSELAYFLTPEAKDEMLIDQNQDRKYLNISLDLSLSSMPCSALSLNLLDPKGANVMHVSHEIYKQRISRAGEAIGKPIRDSLQNVATTPTHLAAASLPSRGLRTNHSTTHLRCHSCFQSHIDEDDCCQSCKDVQSSFLERGLDDRPDGYVFGQCAEELYRSHPPLSGESCRLQARLQVRKVPATLHLGVARHFDPSTVQAKLQELTVSADFSHQIQDLSFGPEFPGLVSVLQGRQKSSHRAPLSEHYQNVNNDAAVTGLWLNYDFTPFEVRDNLRQEVRRARQRLEQASATAKQELDRHLAQVKADCREKLRSTTIQWERAVLQERKALKERFYTSAASYNALGSQPGSSSSGHFRDFGDYSFIPETAKQQAVHPISYIDVSLRIGAVYKGDYAGCSGGGGGASPSPAPSPATTATTSTTAPTVVPDVVPSNATLWYELRFPNLVAASHDLTSVQTETSLAIAVQDTMARQGLTNVKCFVTNLRAGSIQATVGLYMSNVVELEQVKWFGGNHLTKVSWLGDTPTIQGQPTLEVGYSQPVAPAPPPTNMPVYTIDQVRDHTTSTDCWMAAHGKAACWRWAFAAQMRRPHSTCTTPWRRVSVH